MSQPIEQEFQPEKIDFDPRTKLLGHFPKTKGCICEETGRAKNNCRCPECRGLGRVPIIEGTLVSALDPKTLENELRKIENTGYR